MSDGSNRGGRDTANLTRVSEPSSPVNAVAPTQRRRGGGFVRDAGAGEFLEIFLVSAVSAVLLIRGYLELTGYPQIGGGGLHIAHMLWGGLLMLIALVALLSVLGRGWKRPAALIGGAGFGTFIDELGKFITEDNDYFFQPTVSILYVIFVLIYLASKMITDRARLSAVEHVVNATEALGLLAAGRLDAARRDRALRHLAQVDATDPIARALIPVLSAAEVAPTHRSLATRVRDGLSRLYERLIRNRWFGRVVIGIVTIQAALLTLQMFFLTVREDTWTATRELDYVEIAHLLSIFGASLFAGYGLFRLVIRRDRRGALLAFERSILVVIFLVQFFAFAAYEFAALIGLAIHLLELAMIRFALHQETAIADARSATNQVAPGDRSVPALSTSLRTPIRQSH